MMMPYGTCSMVEWLRTCPYRALTSKKAQYHMVDVIDIASSVAVDSVLKQKIGMYSIVSGHSVDESDLERG
jgi:hypothetical protein